MPQLFLLFIVSLIQISRRNRRSFGGGLKKHYNNQQLLLIGRRSARKDSGHGMNTTVDLCISATACMLQHMDSDPDEDQQMTEPHPAR